jgi:hypothetical protein
VEGRQPCGALSQRVSRSPTVIPGAARRPARTVCAVAAQRASAAVASSRSPWTVRERTRLRPDTSCGPSATRSSHVPGRRSRSDPAPRGLFVMIHVGRARRHRPGAHALGTGSRPWACGDHRGDSRWDGRVPRPRTKATSGPRLRRSEAESVAVSMSAPEEIRTPNLLIRMRLPTVTALSRPQTTPSWSIVAGQPPGVGSGRVRSVVVGS